MKTDIEFGKLFHNHPQMLADLLGLDNGEDYTASSQEFKDIKRTADIVWQSDKHNEQIVVEFQGYYDETIYHRGEIERVMLSLRNLRKTVRLIIVFLDPSFNPNTRSWSDAIKAGSPFYEVVYLKDAIAALETKNPQLPLVQTLAPIFFKDDNQLKKEASEKYRAIQRSPLSPNDKKNLTEVFLSLFTSRFGKLKLEELEMMIAHMKNVRDTVAGQQIFAQGEAKGKIIGRKLGEAKGIKTEIRGLRDLALELDELFEKGIMPEDAYHLQRESLERRLSQKQEQLQAIKMP